MKIVTPNKASHRHERPLNSSLSKNAHLQDALNSASAPCYLDTSFAISPQQKPNNPTMLPLHFPRRRVLYDHLSNALSAQCLAALERLALYSGEPVKDGGK